MPKIYIPWPDTDYPPGHPERCWGTLTVEKELADSTINENLKAGRITDIEADFIRERVGKDFIPPQIFDIMAR